MVEGKLFSPQTTSVPLRLLFCSYLVNQADWIVHQTSKILELVLSPYGVNPWEDTALPAHELNHLEGNLQEHLSFHYTNLIIQRTLSLPPHETSHWEGNLSRIRAVPYVNHSSLHIQVEWLWSGSKTLTHSKAARRTSYPKYSWFIHHCQNRKQSILNKKETHITFNGKFINC